jgi:hypothetical protein
MADENFRWWERSEALKSAMLEALANGLDVDEEIVRLGEAFRPVRRRFGQRRDSDGRSEEDALIDWLRLAIVKAKSETSNGTACKPDLHVWRRNGSNFDRIMRLAEFRPCVCLQLRFRDLTIGSPYFAEYRQRNGIVIAMGVRTKD